MFQKETLTFIEIQIIFFWKNLSVFRDNFKFFNVITSLKCFLFLQVLSFFFQAEIRSTLETFFWPLQKHAFGIFSLAKRIQFAYTDTILIPILLSQDKSCYGCFAQRAKFAEEPVFKVLFLLHWVFGEGSMTPKWRFKNILSLYSYLN